MKKGKLSRFQLEFRKSLLTALVAAFGFIIAFSWRETIQSYVKLLTSLTPIQSNLLESFIVTMVGVLGILLVTKFLSVKNN